jgi:hypothetical protein
MHLPPPPPPDPEQAKWLKKVQGDATREPFDRDFMTRALQLTAQMSLDKKERERRAKNVREARQNMHEHDAWDTEGVRTLIPRSDNLLQHADEVQATSPENSMVVRGTPNFGALAEGTRTNVLSAVAGERERTPPPVPLDLMQVQFDHMVDQSEMRITNITRAAEDALTVLVCAACCVYVLCIVYMYVWCLTCVCCVPCVCPVYSVYVCMVSCVHTYTVCTIQVPQLAPVALAIPEDGGDGLEIELRASGLPTTFASTKQITQPS